MGTQQSRGRVSSSCVAAQAAIAASSKTHQQRITLRMRRPVAVARPPSLLGDSQRSTATRDDGGRGGFDVVRRHCWPRRCFSLTGVLTVAALTWMGMRKKGTVFRILETTANAAAETLAATTLESSDGVTQLGDVLPALSYRALLSPLVWIICLSGFCVLHGFCQQLLLLLRQQRGKRIDKFALLVQSSVFPVHGINRLMAMTHALIAINWGVLVFLKRDNASSSSAERHSASTASAGQAATVSAKLVAAASGVSGVLQSSGLSEAPALGPAGGTTAALPEIGAASMCLWGFGEPVTSHERALLLFSLSYFMYDTWYEGLYGNLYECIHHGVAILGLLHVLGRNVGGRDLIAALVVGELSTPLLHLRYCCVQLAKRLAAVATTSQGGDQTSSTRAASRTDATVERLPTETITSQQQEQHQQHGGGEQLHNDNKGRQRVGAGMAGKGGGKDPSKAFTAQVSSTVSSDMSGFSQRRSLSPNRSTFSAAAGIPVMGETTGGDGSTSPEASRAPSGDATIPRNRLGGSIKSLTPETAAVAYAEGRSHATSRRGRESGTGIREAENCASVAAAGVTGGEEGASVAQAKSPQKGRRGAQTAAPADEAEEAVETTNREERGRSATVAGSSVLPSQGTSATPQTAESCRSLLGSQSLSSSSRYVAAGAARSTEASDDRPPRVRNETFIRSAPDVHIPTADPACTTGAAAVLAAAFSTAVAAAALGAGAAAAVATTAAAAAAVCSFIIFYLVLGLSQRGGDPNSMFATFFHIPAGYVYPSTPRSHTPSNRSGSPAVGRRAVDSSDAASANDAAAMTLEQEIAVFAEAFLKGNGDKLQLCRDALERSFFSTFIIGRALLAPCVVYACVTCPSTPILARASGIFLLVMSCYWLSRILKYVRKRKRPQEEKKKEPTVFTVKPSTDTQGDEEHDG